MYRASEQRQTHTHGTTPRPGLISVDFIALGIVRALRLVSTARSFLRSAEHLTTYPPGVIIGVRTNLSDTIAYLNRVAINPTPRKEKSMIRLSQIL